MPCGPLGLSDYRSAEQSESRNDLCIYPDGPGPPSTAATVVPLEVATQEVTWCLSIEILDSSHLQRSRPLTFRNRKIYENAGCRLCPLLEDCNDRAGRKHAKKGISIKEFGVGP